VERELDDLYPKDEALVAAAIAAGNLCTVRRRLRLRRCSASGRGQSCARRLMSRLSGRQRTEEAIVVAIGAPRQSGCPTWVVLGVKATEAPGVRAA